MNRMYCIETCSTCRKAKTDLEERGIHVEWIDLKNITPKKEELTRWVEKHPKGIGAFFNTSGQLYRQRDLKTKRRELSQEQLLELLSKEGMLIKRPLLVIGEDVIVGYTKERYDAFFSKR